MLLRICLLSFFCLAQTISESAEPREKQIGLKMANDLYIKSLTWLTLELDKKTGGIESVNIIKVWLIGKNTVGLFEVRFKNQFRPVTFQINLAIHGELINPEWIESECLKKFERNLLARYLVLPDAPLSLNDYLTEVEKALEKTARRHSGISENPAGILRDFFERQRIVYVTEIEEGQRSLEKIEYMEKGVLKEHVFVVKKRGLLDKIQIDYKELEFLRDKLTRALDYMKTKGPGPDGVNATILEAIRLAKIQYLLEIISFYEQAKEFESPTRAELFEHGSPIFKEYERKSQLILERIKQIRGLGMSTNVRPEFIRKQVYEVAKMIGELHKQGAVIRLNGNQWALLSTGAELAELQEKLDLGKGVSNLDLEKARITLDTLFVEVARNELMLRKDYARSQMIETSLNSLREQMIEAFRIHREVGKALGVRK